MDPNTLRSADLPRRLKQAREQQSLSARGLSVRAGLCPQSVRDLETGESGRIRGIRVDVAERLARALGVSPGWLAFGEADTGYQGPAEGLGCAGLRGRLAETRKRAGRSQYALSVAAGLGEEAVRHLEMLGKRPRLGTVERLAAVLGCSPGWLAFGT